MAGQDQLAFIDTHHHLWELNRFHYDWLSGEGWPGHTALLGDYSSVRTDYGIDELLRDFADSHVVKSVHVEAAYAGPDPVEETRWLQGLADEHGFPHALVVFCDLEADGGEAELERHLEFANVRGVRLRGHPEDTTKPSFRSGYASLAKHDLSYELNASPGQLLPGRDLALEHPDVQVILGHTGFPLERSDEYFRTWESEMRALAEASNVAAKISGLGMVDHDWSVDSIRPYVLGTIDAFGVDRCMFGTNWPVDALFSTYAELIDTYRVLVADFTPEEQRRLFSQNAERFYRI